MLNAAVLTALALVVGCGKADSSKPDPGPVAKPDPAPAARPDPRPAPIDCVGFADHMVELSRGVKLKGLQGDELKAAEEKFEVKVKAQRADLIDTCKKIGEKDRAHVACVIKARTPDDVRACPPPEN